MEALGNLFTESTFDRIAATCLAIILMAATVGVVVFVFKVIIIP